MSEAGQVDLVGIVGAGFMGSGIAESTARAGISVVLHEPTQAPLDLSRERLTASVQRAVQRGKLSAQEAEDVLARITWTTTFDDLAGAALVVEAIVETPEIKASLFERLDALVAPSALLASNPSSI